MPTIRVVPKEEAQQTRRSKTPGVRLQRMRQFTEYAQMLVDNPDQAVVYEDLGEAPQQFVLSLRGAFRRAGVRVVVRKRRSRDEVRAWLAEPGEAAGEAVEQETLAEPEPAQTEQAATEQTPRRRRTRRASA